MQRKAHLCDLCVCLCLCKLHWCLLLIRTDQSIIYAHIYIYISFFRHLWRHVLQTYLHHDIHISIYRSGCPTQSFWIKSKIRAFVCFVCVANLLVLDRHCWTVQRTCTLTFSLLCWCWDQAGNSTFLGSYWRMYVFLRVSCLFMTNYCWFKKSCTTWDVKNLANNGINYLSTG